MWFIGNLDSFAVYCTVWQEIQFYRFPSDYPVCWHYSNPRFHSRNRADTVIAQEVFIPYFFFWTFPHCFSVYRSRLYPCFSNANLLRCFSIRRSWKLGFRFLYPFTAQCINSSNIFAYLFCFFRIIVYLGTDPGFVLFCFVF